MVPLILSAGTPCLLATAIYRHSRMEAVALMVMEVLTLSRGIPLNRASMSRRLLTGTPTLPTSPRARGVVGVVADLGRQVEGDGEARLALLQQVVVPPVGLLGRGVPRVLAHGPQPAAVHVGLDSAGVWILPRVPNAQGVVVVRRLQILRRVDGLLPQPRVRGELQPPLRVALHHRVQGTLPPLVLALAGQSDSSARPGRRRHKQRSQQL